MRNYITTDMRVAFFIFIVSFWSCGRTTEQVIVLPGLGITIDGDTIRLRKTTEQDLVRDFQVDTKKTVTSIGSSCGFDEAGDEVSIENFRRQIYHNGIFFYFDGYSKDKLLLEKIEISDESTYPTKINDSLVLGQKVINIERYFPKRQADDNTEYWYELNSYGIDLGLSDTNSYKKLSFISVYDPS